VSSLPTSARLFAGERVIIHSALFGLLRADDPIPAYRLSHDSRLPGLRLAAHWRDGISRALDAYPGLVIDLRSEAYVALGPVPPGPGRFLLRVVSDAEDGTVRAISHANKLSKGRLIRSLLLAGLEHPDVESLISWSEQEGIRLRVRTPGELELVGY
jgi:cytoplasmic iron level regulating protein YaaA (DUF328/UPF0246 family)